MKNKKLLILCAVLIVIAVLIGGIIMAVNSGVKPIGEDDFLKADGTVLRNKNGTGDIVCLRGVNAGGYLLQEFWMCQTEYSSTDEYTVTCEMDIYETLTDRFSESEMRELVDIYQENYWTEADFDNCADLGINCIRLPFWYMNLVDFEGNYIDGGFDRIDWFIEEAGKRGIYVILDMHGAPGSQNGSDHSGIDGGDSKKDNSEFFFGENAAKNQELFYDIWETVAKRYAGNPVVAGYDLLNEPYCTYRYNSGLTDGELHKLCWNIYDKAYDIIRAVDSEHIIIMEATWDAWDLPHPIEYGWTNVMYEYHNYLYDDYDNANGQQIENMKNKLNGINSMNYNVPSLMGEFNYFNNPDAWEDGIRLLNDSGISWTIWTYKTTPENGMWGLYHHTSGRKADVTYDSYDRIASKWAQVGEASANEALCKVIKKNIWG